VTVVTTSHRLKESDGDGFETSVSGSNMSVFATAGAAATFFFAADLVYTLDHTVGALLRLVAPRCLRDRGLVDRRRELHSVGFRRGQIRVRRRACGADVERASPAGVRVDGATLPPHAAANTTMTTNSIAWTFILGLP